MRKSSQSYVNKCGTSPNDATQYFQHKSYILWPFVMRINLFLHFYKKNSLRFFKNKRFSDVRNPDFFLKNIVKH